MILIGIAGRAGAGKDTVADYLVREHGFKKLSWAAALKAGMAAMGFPEPANRDDKEKLIPGFTFSWREAAQKLGTQWGREMDPDIWVKLVANQLAELESIGLAVGQQPRVVLSDVRFENEAALIRRGGQMWHIAGRQVDLGANAGHASEKGVEYYPTVDGALDNSGTPAHLYNQIEHLLRGRM